MKKITWKTERRRVGDIKAWDRNPRRMSAHDAEQLRKSLDRFGLADIPIIQPDGTLIGGHQRVAILRETGRAEDEIDVRVPDRKLTEKEFEELNLRLNRNLGEWDWDALANWEAPQLIDAGFSESELSKYLDLYPADEKDDVIPENAPTRVKPGDLWALGEHRLLCGDSTKKEDVERLMGGKKADMVFQDPPYALFGNSTGMAGVADDKMIQPFFREVFSQRGFSKGGCHWYTCCDWRTYPVMSLCQEEVGLTVKQLIIWDKMSPAMGNLYRNQYECIVVSINTPTGNKVVSGRASNKIRVTDTNVWQIKRNKEGLHGAEKPVELCGRAIKNSSKNNDVVLDLFLGSGSTLIAAEKTGRICYGMEIDCKYADVIINRWELFTGKEAKKVL